MKYALLVAALSGCVTTAGFVKKTDVSLPLLIGAVTADLVVTSIVASQAESFSAAGSIATGLAFTGIDTGIGCLLGACSVLRP